MYLRTSAYLVIATNGWVRRQNYSVFQPKAGEATAQSSKELNIWQKVKILVIFVLASFPFAHLLFATNETDFFDPLYHFVA
jgi:hypothetical protein